MWTWGLLNEWKPLKEWDEKQVSLGGRRWAWEEERSQSPSGRGWGMILRSSPWSSTLPSSALLLQKGNALETAAIFFESCSVRALVIPYSNGLEPKAAYLHWHAVPWGFCSLCGTESHGPGCGLWLGGKTICSLPSLSTTPHGGDLLLVISSPSALSLWRSYMFSFQNF